MSVQKIVYGTEITSAWLFYERFKLEIFKYIKIYFHLLLFLTSLQAIIIYIILFLFPLGHKQENGKSLQVLKCFKYEIKIKLI